MKVALVHDDFVQAGGAESLFATIASIWPDAPIYTSLVNWDKLPQSIDRDRVKTSFIQKIPFAIKFYKLLLPIYPLAFESFNFDNFDLVISSTTRFAKSIITKPKTIHICYANSLPRFLWDQKAQKNYLPPTLRFILRLFFSWLRRWDKVAAKRVDCYIANSQNVSQLVTKIYGVDSQVVYPFADINFFKPAKIHNWQLKNQKYFLVVNRLVRWKKIDIAIEAAINLGINLKIVGVGPDGSRLKKLITRNYKSETRNKIEFLNRVSKDQLRELYQNSQALIVTQEEDFGISAVEAQACGIPVIAFSKGGQQEIVITGKTGVLFNKQSESSLKDAIAAASRIKWSVSACRNNSLKFKRAIFIKNLKTQVNKYAIQS